MTDNQHGTAHKLPPLAFVAGAIGFVLTIGLIGFIAWEAFIRSEARAPSIAVQATRVSPSAGGYIVEFDAKNNASLTAAAVEVEATLTVAEGPPVVSSVTLDYIPGNSYRQGGIFLPVDPAAGTLTMRALGYARP